MLLVVRDQPQERQGQEPAKRAHQDQPRHVAEFVGGDA